MISDQRLKKIAKGDIHESTADDCIKMAKDLLARRPCQHHWNVLRLVEAGGRYQYCTLCGAKKLAQ
ncbi:MAG: hypothetical protein [Caudoviricetes sp.]|nr:MAG: hypothetical protein [Caudoviricetes sp.]